MAADAKVSKALEQLVTKRQQQIAYLRRSHLPELDHSKSAANQNSNQIYWLNTIGIDQDSLNEFVGNDKQVLAWFCLGMSMAKLLDSDTGPMLVNSFIQLMEEFRYEFGNRIVGGFAYLRAKNIEDKLDVKSDSPIKPIIWKQNNKVVYQFLDTPRLPSQLDYCLTVYSMMSVLYLLYSKFLDPTCSHEKWRKAIEILDQKISQQILKEITDNLTKLTYKTVESEVLSLLPTLGDHDSSKFIKEIAVASQLNVQEVNEQGSAYQL